MLYILLHLANFGIGAYKAYHLGILPTDADWGMHLDVKEVRACRSSKSCLYSFDYHVADIYLFISPWNSLAEECRSDCLNRISNLKHAVLGIETSNTS
jgi:hypothetical protein